MPRLFRVDAQRAVADVPVLAEHVGVSVVHEVVRVLPRLRRGREVPLPGGGVDLRIAHPVPLTVQHVVTDLHVLQDLGGGQRRRAREPRGRQDRDEQQRPPACLQASLDRDHPPDVPRVVLSASGEHLVADPVQLPAELLGAGVDELCGGRHASAPTGRSRPRRPARTPSRTGSPSRGTGAECSSTTSGGASRGASSRGCPGSASGFVQCGLRLESCRASCRTVRGEPWSQGSWSVGVRALPPFWTRGTGSTIEGPDVCHQEEER